MNGPKTLLSLSLAFTLTACSAAAQNPITPTPSDTSPSASSSPTENPEQLLSGLVSSFGNSVRNARSQGVVESLSHGEELFYVEVYDPNSDLDYKGGGWVVADGTYELVLELDMYQLWRIQYLVNHAKAAEVTRLADGRVQLTATTEHYPTRVLIETDADGLVTGLEYPDETTAVSVTISYEIDQAAQDLLKQANETL